MPRSRCATARGCAPTSIGPDGARTVSGADDVRALRQGRAAARIHAGGMGPAQPDLSGDPRRLLVQASGVRAAGPGGVGAARLRRHRGRLARRRQVAGPARSQFAGRVPRLLRRDRMGGARSRGAAARSGCSASPTTRPASGSSPRCARRISPRCCRGRAPTTSIATAPARTASSPAASSSAGGRAACCAISMAMPSRPITTSTPASAPPAPPRSPPTSSRGTAPNYLEDVLRASAQ